MSQNPLQNYFRQPKIYTKLPTLGKFCNSDTISGDVEKIPIYGMTGMDQIIVKTPDALLNGESTVKVIQSCCPTILNAWELSNLDIDSLLVAIRIATYGTKMGISSICKACSTENSYDVDISSFLQHYNNSHFESSVIVNELVLSLKPLTYKQATVLGLENFSLQKRLIKINQMEDNSERKDLISNIYMEFGLLQNKVLLASIEHIETPDNVVSEYGFIKEWLDNCDQEIIKQIRKVMDGNSERWKIPPTTIICNDCGKKETVEVDLDASSFFDIA